MKVKKNDEVKEELEEWDETQGGQEQPNGPTMRRRNGPSADRQKEHSGKRLLTSY